VIEFVVAVALLIIEVEVDLRIVVEK